MTKYVTTLSAANQIARLIQNGIKYRFSNLYSEFMLVLRFAVEKLIGKSFNLEPYIGHLVSAQSELAWPALAPPGMRSQVGFSQFSLSAKLGLTSCALFLSSCRAANWKKWRYFYAADSASGFILSVCKLITRFIQLKGLSTMHCKLLPWAKSI